jgi:RES domain
VTRPPLRDARLMDALEAIETQGFSGNVWRVVREGRDPCLCNASGGRWDDGTFDVLYTSMERNGALAEMYFHLMRGQPVFPSKLRFNLFELKLDLKAVLPFPALDDLKALGLDTRRYGQLDYANRHEEYPTTQQIGEIASFLGCDGMIVPSARYACANMVVFCRNAGELASTILADHGLINWSDVARELTPAGPEA